jgi:hypothetical protein
MEKTLRDYINLIEEMSSKVTKEPLDEISQDLKNRYVGRAVTAHGGYNMARRNTTDKEKEYWARKEKNTKKGISRAVRKPGELD